MVAVSNVVSAEILTAAVVILDLSCLQMNVTVSVSITFDFVYSLALAVQQCHIEIACYNLTLVYMS